MDRDGKLFNGNWVGSTVGFCLQGKCGMVHSGVCVMKWVVIPSQFNALANGAKCSLDAASLDLLTISRFAFPDLSSKNGQDQQLLCLSQVLKVGINIGGKKLDPVPPVMLPCCESCCHDHRVDVGIDSVESTPPSKAFGRQQQLQKLFCGSGKQ